MAIYGLVGTSGFAREVMPHLGECVSKTGASEKCTFVDIRMPEEPIAGYDTILEQDFLGNRTQERYFNVAIADYKTRKRIVDKYTLEGCKPKSIIAKSALILDRNHIGDGAIICGFSHLTSDIRIGRFFHCNIYSYVAHDSVVGDFVTLAPQVCCNGNVHICDYAYVGTGAVIKQGTPDKPLVIGEGAVIGMGAVVTKDVPPYEVVVGNPARPLRK